MGHLPRESYSSQLQANVAATAHDCGQGCGKKTCLLTELVQSVFRSTSRLNPSQIWHTSMLLSQRICSRSSVIDALNFQITNRFKAKAVI